MSIVVCVSVLALQAVPGSRHVAAGEGYRAP